MASEIVYLLKLKMALIHDIHNTREMTQAGLDFVMPLYFREACLVLT